jgi:hypothetical protein
MAPFGADFSDTFLIVVSFMLGLAVILDLKISIERQGSGS